MRIDIHVCEMLTPSDVSELARLLQQETVHADKIIAIVGKTEGTGLGKDGDREGADSAVRTLLAGHLGCGPNEVGNRVRIILSGGSPGVITPHLAVFTRTADAAPASGEARLALGVANSRTILPEEIGRFGQIAKVRAAVEAAMGDAGLSDPSDVDLVLVKAPTLSPQSIAEAARRGATTVTTDISIGPEGAMCYSNDGSALGVALALSEAQESEINDDMVRKDWSIYSDVAMTSSAGEKTHAEVLLMGNSRGSTSDLRIGHRSMRDITDISAVSGALESAGVEVTGGDVRSASTSVVYGFVKMILPKSPRIHGRRITLLDDPNGYHVAKAMGGYLFATTTGRSAVFVSGGERNSHQGPPDGNPLALIVRTSS